MIMRLWESLSRMTNEKLSASVVSDIHMDTKDAESSAGRWTPSSQHACI